MPAGRGTAGKRRDHDAEAGTRDVRFAGEFLNVLEHPLFILIVGGVLSAVRAPRFAQVGATSQDQATVSLLRATWSTRWWTPRMRS